jgi:uncharacterized protein YhhL (DUF1145 family)
MIPHKRLVCVYGLLNPYVILPYDIFVYVSRIVYRLIHTMAVLTLNRAQRSACEQHKGNPAVYRNIFVLKNTLF